MTEHIVAAYETESAALEAERELELTGIEPTAMRRFTPVAQAGDNDTRQRTEETNRGGFWAWLTGENEPPPGEPAQDSVRYDERVAAGNTVLSVTVADDSKIHKVVEILDAHHPVDIHERTVEPAEVAAPTAGGTRFEPTVATGGERVADRVKDVTPMRTPGGTSEVPVTEATGTPATPGVVPASASAGTTPVRASARGTEPGKDEQVIPLAEEHLEVGKRTIDRGTRRIRRYVVEQPVERDVTLRGERVTVERRRPLGATEAPGPGAFEERTVEVHETEEVPEVRKTARVEEEVAVRREQIERHETVRDTLRRDEVEVTPEDAPATGPAREKPKRR